MVEDELVELLVSDSQDATLVPHAIKDAMITGAGVYDARQGEQLGRVAEHKGCVVDGPDKGKRPDAPLLIQRKHPDEGGQRLVRMSQGKIKLDGLQDQVFVLRHAQPMLLHNINVQVRACKVGMQGEKGRRQDLPNLFVGFLGLGGHQKGRQGNVHGRVGLGRVLGKKEVEIELRRGRRPKGAEEEQRVSNQTVIGTGARDVAGTS